MNVIIEYISHVDFSGFVMSSRVVMPLMKAFMDDLNLLATSKSETDILLSRASTALSWARMDCRGKKSRHLLMIKGRTVSDSSFTFTNSSGEEEIIPSIATDPTRFLGKVITTTLSESHSRNSLKENIADALTSLDKCFLLGTDKVWIVQYLLSEIRYPFITLIIITIITIVTIIYSYLIVITVTITLGHTIYNIKINNNNSILIELTQSCDMI